MFYQRFYKWISLLLCASICMGSPAIISMAKTTEDIYSENTNFEDTNSEIPNVSETISEDSSEDLPSENPSTEESSSENLSSEESVTETTTENPTEEFTTDENFSEDFSSEEFITETTTEEFTEELTTEELFTEEFTTDEDLSVDAERAINIEAAATAFDELLKEKQLMALLYRTDSYEVQQYSGSYDTPVATIYSGHTLYITGVDFSDEQVWYQVRFWQNAEEQIGYIEGYYLAYSDEDWINWEQEFLTDIYFDSTTYGIALYSNVTNTTDTSDISAFPAIYQDSLRALKKQHPSWTFVPMNTGLDFNTVVSKEMGSKSLIQNTSSNAAKGWVGNACPTESGWYYATKPAVEYYMNPCNFLTETYIFQFEQLTFNSTYHNVSAIQSFLNNTFMKGKIPDDASNRTYAQAFYNIGKDRKLSPIHLASRVYQEQGKGTSDLISGTYKGYEGYYNYFNVGVNGSSTEEKVRKGLTYAKEKGWNTRYKSLEGGAATIGNNYILKGQDTIYLEKFNVDANSPHGLYNHQYMQNIQAPASESYSTKRMYEGAGSLDSGFVFKIPVFQNMPGEKAIQSISLDKDEIVLYRPDTITDATPNLKSTDTLTVTITPSDTTDDQTITWSSSNPKVVSVKTEDKSQKAVITALTAGVATITAESQNNKTAQCNVKVEAPIYSLKLTNLNVEGNTTDSSASIYAGQNLTLTADYLPKDTTSDTTIIWSSSDPSVASVSGGKVTAHAKGSAVITATIAGISASYTIIVNAFTVTFMAPDYIQILKEIPVTYGKTIPQDSFPSIGSTADKQFIGWYTGKNGSGTRFDETTLVHDSSTVLYPYFEEQGKGFYVIPVGDQTYTGAAIKPQIHVYDSVSYSDGSTELIELIQGQDYTVSYKNNKEVNTSATKVPTITVKGKGNYAGTDSVYFNILPKSLTDHDITVGNLSVPYNGKVQKSSPTVYWNNKKLTNKTDYTLTYPYTDSGAYKNAGVYPIIIKGTKNYTGTITIYETISKKTMLNKVSIAKIPNQVYKNELVDKGSGIGITPDKLQVTYKKQPLIESTDGGKTGDYTISYTNNMAIGTATATITAVDGSAYAGSKSVTYKIVGTNINKAAVNGVTPKTYTGNEADVWQNNVTLTLNNTALKESMDNGITGDYIVSYINTAKAGTATVLFKGINEYSGQIKKTYKITGYDLTNSNDITMSYCTEDAPTDLISIHNLSEIHSPYMKGGAKPQVILYYKGDELTAGKDYTVTYTNNRAVTTAQTPENKLPKIVIKGKGNFKGSLQGTWTITDGQMSDNNGKLTMTAKDITFKSKADNYKTMLTITDANGKKLAAGKDYDKNVIYSYANDTQVTTSDGSKITRKSRETVSKGDIINANTYICVTVEGIGAYAGNGNATLSTTYRIIATDIAKAKLKVNTKTYQNGKAVTLEPADIKLTLNNAALTYGTDYIIDDSTYTNNTKKGKATVILKGTGTNFGGQRKITFSIGSKILNWWKRN